MEARVTTEYGNLSDRFDDLSRRVAEALRAGDLYQLAAWRLERAWVEMQLRDLYGPWSGEGDRWQTWMWDDIQQARRAAAQLAARVGDSGLEQRLLHPHPGWFRTAVVQ